MDTLKKWEIETNELSFYFIIKYFGKDSLDDAYWIAGDVGGVLSVNDYFFNLDDIVNYLRYKYSKKDLFEYYDYQLEFYSKPRSKNDYLINIKNYKYGNKKSKKRSRS